MSRGSKVSGYRVIQVTCRAKLLAPKVYEAGVCSGTILCAKCGREVPPEGDVRHTIDGARRR